MALMLIACCIKVIITLHFLQAFSSLIIIGDLFKEDKIEHYSYPFFKFSTLY